MIDAVYWKVVAWFTGGWLVSPVATGTEELRSVTPVQNSSDELAQQNVEQYPIGLLLVESKRRKMIMV